MVKVMNNKYDFRIEMIKTAQKFSVSETAHIFNVSRPTVYKWINRFKSEGFKGLQDRSSRPLLSPNSLSDKMKKKILKLRKRWLCLSPERMINEFGVIADIKTIYKVLEQHGLMNKKPKIAVISPIM
jgi:transposase